VKFIITISTNSRYRTFSYSVKISTQRRTIDNIRCKSRLDDTAFNNDCTGSITNYWCRWRGVIFKTTTAADRNMTTSPVILH